jgi:hypothetical protein
VPSSGADGSAGTTPALTLLAAEHAEDLAAAHLEVDPVDRALRPEGLDESGGRDGQVGVRNSCHARRVSVGGFTPPSLRFHRFRTRQSHVIGWLTASRKRS